MTGTEKLMNSSRLATITIFSVVVAALTLSLTIIPEAEGARGAKGGNRSARSGGSVRHSSASRNRTTRPTTGAGPSRKATPSKAANSRPAATKRPGASNTAKPRATGNRNNGARRSSNRYNARKDARRDYKKWRRNRALFAVGVRILTRPRYSTTVVVRGGTYYCWGGVYYVSSGSSYVVAVPPPTTVVYAVPTYTTVVYAGTTPYYYAGNAYYTATDAPAARPEIPEDVVLEESEDNPPMIEDDHNYEVVVPPVGATVPYLPDEADERNIDGRVYFVYEDSYYRAFVSDGETIFQVVEDPTA